MNREDMFCKCDEHNDYGDLLLTKQLNKEKIEAQEEYVQGLVDALEDIKGWDEGYLGGDSSWTVNQWHDYIRYIVTRIQNRANQAL